MLGLNKKTITYLGISVWSFLTMIALTMISHYRITLIGFVQPCLFAVALFVYLKAYELYMGKNAVGGNDQAESGVRFSDKCFFDCRFAIPLGIIVSVCSVIGSHFDMEEHTMEKFGIKDPLFILILIPFFVALFMLFFDWLDSFSKKLREWKIVGNRAESDGSTDIKKLLSGKSVAKNIIIYAAIMLVCWLPYYLSFFPGGVTNDDFECLNMIWGNIPWTNHHPVIFTATMKLFITLFAGNGNVEFALGMMSLMQMIMMAVTLATSIVWLEYHGVGKIVRYIVLAFFSLHSAFGMFSVCLTKDISFACVIVLLVQYLYDLCSAYKSDSDAISKKGIKVCVMLGVLLLLTIITRNNGTLVAIVTVIVAVVVFKKIRKSLIITAAIVFALNGIYKGPVWNVIGIEKQSFVESAAIPLSQIAYTIYSDGVIEGEDREYLESVLAFDIVKKNYEPGYVDSYKFDENFNTEIVDANPGKVIATWAHLLPKNFGLYVEGYLYSTIGYWHYGETNTLCSEGVRPNDLGLESTDYIEKVTGISIAGLLSKLMLMVRKLPILCLFTQMPIEILMTLIVVCQFVRRKKGYMVLVCVPLLAIYLSILIAVPSFCLFRYMLPFFFLWPVIIFGLVDGSVSE